MRRYVHIGTGNYNATTAQIYTDFGLFTSDPEVGDDVQDVFNYLTGYSKRKEYRELLIAPVSFALDSSRCWNASSTTRATAGPRT